jgi:hypothetical protein
MSIPLGFISYTVAQPDDESRAIFVAKVGVPVHDMTVFDWTAIIEKLQLPVKTVSNTPDLTRYTVVF